MSELSRIARENLIHTYLTLARGTPGTRIADRDGYTLVSGQAPLTIANMAIDFRLLESARTRVLSELLASAQESTFFRVFTLSGDVPADLEDSLTAQGFAVDHVLTALTCPVWEVPPPEPFVLLSSDHDRRSVSEFMVRQFSYRKDPNIRRTIAQANSNSPFELWCYPNAHEPKGALMLVDTPHSIGLYNLCSAPSQRRKGLGTKMLRFAQFHAYLRGKPLVFQADGQSLAWYLRRGAIHIGFAKSFTKNKI